MSVCPEHSVLIAEDNPMLLRLLLRLFETSSYRVIARENGAAALEALRSNGMVDLIIADMDMPRLSGVCLCREVCSRDCWIPVILVTGRVPDDVDFGDLPSNVSRCLQKPFCVEGLVELADRIIAARSCGAPARAPSMLLTG
jgi:CheY-like chemotaxis protein